MSRVASRPPKRFMDGCTLAPDRLGRVSHRDICDEHDLAYFQQRTLWAKTKADARWAVRILYRHRSNTPWQPVALGLAVIGWIAISTVGAFMWRRAQYFRDDDPV